MEALLAAGRPEAALAGVRYLADSHCDALRVLEAGRTLRRLWAQVPSAARRGRLRVAFVGNMVLQPLAALVDALCAGWGLELDAFVAPFDQYQQLIRQPGSRLYQERWDLIALCLDNEALAGDSLYRLAGGADPDLLTAVAARAAEVEEAVRLLATTAGGAVAVTLFPLPTELALGAAYIRTAPNPARLWRELNLRLLQLASEHAGLYPVDLESLFAEHGRRTLCDPRRKGLGGLVLTNAALLEVARALMRLLRASKGLQKKVAVVDLDGTLWAGVLGEDGPSGIQVGPGHRQLQQLLLACKVRGTLLAVASRNDSDQVLEVLERHPDMVLREADFVRVEATWSPKDETVRRLAEQLNLGLDSFVFIDDNPAERERMRHFLPEVYTVELPADAAWYAPHVAALGLFDGLTVTAEDHGRTRSYRNELARRQLQEQSESLEAYLSRLQIQVQVAPLDEAALPRACQLTNKTNQFNMTTLRMTEADLRHWLTGAPERLALCVRVADRFEASGLVGLLLIDRAHTTWTLRNFLLSCRVLGRGVESAVLAGLAAYMRAEGAESLVGEFRPSGRNHMAETVYAEHGFLPAAPAGETARWRYDLSAGPLRCPAHIQLDFAGAPHPVVNAD